MSAEKRAHARVAVPINARVVDGSREDEFVIRDISRRGLFLYAQKAPAAMGTVLTLKLAITAGIKPLTVKGKVVRLLREPASQGGRMVGVGLHFVDLDEAAEAKLLDLIDRAMVGRGTMMRAFPRIHYLLEIVCTTSTEFKALMVDIGEGGVGLSVDRRLDINEGAWVQIHRPGEDPLKLHGWVLSCRKNEDEGRYRVGVRFSRLPPGAREELNKFLRGLYRK